MYYLYKKKPSHDDRSASHIQTSSTPTVSVQSSTVGGSGQRHHHGGQHHLYQHAFQSLSLPHPAAEESSDVVDIPNGPLDTSSQQPHRISRVPEPEDQERKQKDDQMARRMPRRRGLEEYDHANDMLRPTTPSRINCLRCQQDIGYNHHRISCNSDQKQHTFCRTCIVHYVDAWVNGEAQYELRQGGRLGRSRGLFALPCMSPTCQNGCFQEASLQPLLTHTMFTRCRQKLVRARAEQSQARSMQDAGSSSSSDSQPMSRCRGQDMEQGAQPPLQRQPQPQSQQLYSQLSQQPIPSGFLPAPAYGAQNLKQIRREPPDYDQYQRHYYAQQQLQQSQEQQQQQQQRELEQLQQDEGGRSKQQPQLPQGDEYMQQHTYQRAQEQRAAVPLPQTILRRSSTTSTGNTSRKIAQRVRFSFHSANEMALVDDDSHSSGCSEVASSESSASSLTTCFPSSVNPRARESEQIESDRFDRQQKHHQQVHHQQQKEQQLTLAPAVEEHVVDANLITCQCCYEEFSSKTSPIIRCDRRKLGEPSHMFCSKCVRTYVEEWIFGAATYQLRPGQHCSQGQSPLILPCLHGDCSEGGFPDEQLLQLLTPRSMGHYWSKICPLRTEKQDDEEHLVQLAIRMSLEHDQIQKRVTAQYQTQASAPHEVPDEMHVTPTDKNPPSTLNIPYTTLSNMSSLTSFNTFPRSSRSLSDIPGGTLSMNILTLDGDGGQKVGKHPLSANQHDSILGQSVHSVEEAMTKAKVRTCPNCMTKFLKDEDFCNKLKCPSCKTALCYICRSVIPAQGYEHFCVHKQGGCAACLGAYCPLWTQVDDDNRRDMAEMRERGLDEANRIWEESLLAEHSRGTEIRIDVDLLLQQPPASHGR